MFTFNYEALILAGYVVDDTGSTLEITCSNNCEPVLTESTINKIMLNLSESNIKESDAKELVLDLCEGAQKANIINIATSPYSKLK